MAILYSPVRNKLGTNSYWIPNLNRIKSSINFSWGLLPVKENSFLFRFVKFPPSFRYSSIGILLPSTLDAEKEVKIEIFLFTGIKLDRLTVLPKKSEEFFSNPPPQK